MKFHVRNFVGATLAKKTEYFRQTICRKRVEVKLAVVEVVVLIIPVGVVTVVAFVTSYLNRNTCAKVLTLR